jgi:hypothetical protein
VVGRVESVRYTSLVPPNADKNIIPLINSNYVVSVTKSTNDVSEKRITVVLPGGALDGISVDAEGIPTLQVGHEYVFFLGNKFTDGLYYPLSGGSAIAHLDNGKFVLDGGGAVRNVEVLGSDLVERKEKERKDKQRLDTSEQAVENAKAETDS